MSWEAPADARCDKCRLCTTAKSIKIDGVGPEKAEIMFVGGEPGVTENIRAKPFQARYGSEFEFMLGKAGIRRGDVYVTHALKCHGGSKKEYVDACRDYLLEEIEKIKPTVIVPIGAVAVKALYGPKAKIKDHRGRMITKTIGKHTCKVIPTFDINTILAGDTEKRKHIVRDFKIAVDYTEGTLEHFNDEKLAGFTLVTANSEADIKDAIDLILAQPKIAVDCETRGLDIRTEGFLVTLQIAVSPDAAITIPVNHPEAETDPAITKKLVRQLFRDYKGEVFAHNGKYDQDAIWTFTGEVPRITFDTMMAHNLITGDSAGNDLKTMTWRYTDFGGYEEEAAPLMEAVEYDTTKVELEPLARYGALDTIATYRIAEILQAKLDKRGDKAHNLMAMMAELSGIMAEVEVNGIRVNWDYLADYEKRLKERRETIIDDLRKEYGKEIQMSARDMGVEKFNFASNQHLGHLLYTRLGLEAPMTTPKGRPSVAKGALAKVDHPISKSLLELSGIAQNLKMYVEAYPKFRVGDRIRPQYSIIRYSDDSGDQGTRSGRFSSRNPNIQQLPKLKKGEIRKIFIPDDENSLIGDVDFNQLELRVAAMYCQDVDMVNFFNGDGDYHSFVASELLGVKLDEVTPEQRSIGKALNFSILYGAGPGKIAMMLDVDEDQAKEYQQQYFERFPAIMDWKDRVEHFVKKHGYVDTLFGRRRAMPDVYSNDKGREFGALRAAVNHTCQSAGADLCYTAIVNVNRFLKEKGLKTRMLFTVHDSVTFSVPKQEVSLIPKIQERMENTGLPFIEETGVKIKVDAKIGRDFGDLMDYNEWVNQ